jgi:uncharacterized membrane protein YbhN (UPF0104 family)
VRLRTVGRIALAILGLAVVAYLVRGAGPDRVLEVLMQAWRWLPLIVLFEGMQALGDFVGLRLILRERWDHIPAKTWIRSGSVAYAMMVLLPAGRAAGEVTRATMLSRYIGAPRAATASTLLQAAYLSANGILSLTACLVVTWSYGRRTLLAVLLAGNAGIQTLICTGLLLTLRHDRLGAWLETMRRRLFPRSRPSPPIEPEAKRRLPWATAGTCIVSRSVQLVQYGVLLVAVGGTGSVRNAFVAHGIHLVGATIGDFVPSQLGVVDSLYRAFAPDLGFGDAPARALSIALVVRIGQLIFASICVLAAAVTRHEGHRGGAASARADAHS